MTKKKNFKTESILDISPANIWDIPENELVQLWEEGKSDEDFEGCEERLLNIIRMQYEVVHYDPDNDREKEMYENGEWLTFTRSNPKKGWVAIRKRVIRQLSDLTYENIKHVSAATLVELLSRNFGGGWESVPLHIRDIIESQFEVTTTTLPEKRMHMPGGTRDKRIEDGFECLEIVKGTWIEAIFIKEKAPTIKLRFADEDTYDEEGNRIDKSSITRRRMENGEEVDEDDDEEDEEDDDYRDDYEKEDDEDDDMPLDPENDETFYSSYAPEADIKDDDEDDDTAGLTVIDD